MEFKMRPSPPIDGVVPYGPASTSVPGGRTLEALLGSGRSFEPGEVARIGVELGRALESAHAAGCRHSYITTRAVVLSADGRLVLASPDEDRQSVDGSASGASDALLYAAPETLQGGKPGSGHSEVYSAGVVLYRLLTGAFPVSAEAVRQGRHVEARHARPDLRGSRVPLALAQVVERAIDPSPEGRYATLDALCADLREASRELHAWDGPAQRRLAQAAALLVVLALAAVAWMVARVPLDPPVVAVRVQHHGASIEAREIVNGMTIELSRLLVQAEGLDVRAALTSFSDRDTPDDIIAFGRERRASFVVNGSMHGESGDWRLVDVSLVRIRDRRAVWAESFSVVDGDIFAVQEQIADAVVGALETRFGPDRRRYSTTAPLQELFLRARALQAAGVDAGRRAAEMFERVAEADPEFVPASAALATALGGIPPGSYDLPLLDTDMAAAARRAHAKDPHLAEANAAMGLLSARLCLWSQGKAFFRESLKRDSGATSTSIDYVLSTLMPVRGTREALEVLADALDADPMSLRLRSVLAHVLVEHGDYDRAIGISRDLVEEKPDLAAIQQTLGRALSLSGRVGKAGEGVPKAESQWGYRGYILAVQGHRIEARRLADAHPDEPARQMLIYAGLSDVERTFDALLRTARRDPWRALTWMGRPEIEPVLRGDPRAASMRDQLNRPEACGGPSAPGGRHSGKASERGRLLTF